MELKDGWNNRILIVDDEESFHQSFEEMLNLHLGETPIDDLARDLGFDVEESFLPKFELLHAKNGKEAYEKIEEAIKEDNPIAVAYIDIRMPPGWDGVETARRIREIDKNIEIVIMTAFSGKSLSEIIHGHGMESLHKMLYLEKQQDDVRGVIQQRTVSLVEKWNAERELALNRQRLRAVLDSTKDAIAMFDKTGHLVFVNRMYKEMFGLSDDALAEMSADELRQQIKQCFQEPELSDEAEASFAEDPENTPDMTIEMKAPERLILYHHMAPVHGTEGDVIGHITVYRDVSKEIEIDQMKEELLCLRAEREREYCFDNIIGNSGKMQGMYALMQQAIQSDITVLIRGESGTGKELVAKSIHYNSQRKSCPFIAVNCAAIPETLIESELFGHERGAFTGAAARRIGRFEQADGGTILLDEIGEMPIHLQARLLRVLQEREIQRIGGTATIPIDVRVIASTNKDLEAAMKAGEFREDLFYRIAAFPIIVPPLRENREDLPLLAEYFLDSASIRADKSITVISTKALELLMNYDWPGNIRELENVIERAVLLETSGILQTSSLPPKILSVRKRIYISTSQDEDSAPTEILELGEVEKRAIELALRATGNNIRQTAKVLGINRATVYRKLEKYKLLDAK